MDERSFCDLNLFVPNVPDSYVIAQFFAAYIRLLETAPRSFGGRTMNNFGQRTHTNGIGSIQNLDLLLNLE